MFLIGISFRSLIRIVFKFLEDFFQIGFFHFNEFSFQKKVFFPILKMHFGLIFDHRLPDQTKADKIFWIVPLQVKQVGRRIWCQIICLSVRPSVRPSVRRSQTLTPIIPGLAKTEQAETENFIWLEGFAMQIHCYFSMKY